MMGNFNKAFEENKMKDNLLVVDCGESYNGIDVGKYNCCGESMPAIYIDNELIVYYDTNYTKLEWQITNEELKRLVMERFEELCVILQNQKDYRESELLEKLKQYD